MPPRTARVLAQAKINLWLHVIGPRPDGYHDVNTAFHLLELADVVTVTVLDEARRMVTAQGPRLPPSGLGPEKDNLAYRAADEFHSRTGWPLGFAIEIVKHIPVGGGLGGGSSDAAAVIRALRRLSPTPIDDDILLEVAAAVGADVTFFTTAAVIATAGGRGDVVGTMMLADPLEQAEVLLVVPDFGISTAEAYRWLKETGRYHPHPAASKAHPHVPAASPWKSFDQGNTFEAVLEPRFPVLREYRMKLEAAGATIARLSGSGSTVFGLFEGLAPDVDRLGVDALVIPTRTAQHVVQVEVRE